MPRQADFSLASGPTTVSPRALAAMSSPLPNHYDPAFVETFGAVEQDLATLFRTREPVVLFQAEALAALEAVARGLVRPGLVALNISTGPYGRAMGPWLESLGATVHTLETAFDEAVDPAEVERMLEEHPEVELVAVVHHETPCGVINPIDEIGPIARAHGALTFADCASSLGGVPLHFDDWQLDVCVGASQKCLAAPCGLSPIAVSPAAWAALEQNPAAPRGSFLSLLDWREKRLQNGKFPFAPSVADVVGLAAACREVVEFGPDAWIDRHERAARAVRAGVRAMGLETFPRDDAYAAAPVTVVSLPDEVTDTQVRDHIRDRYGVMIQDAIGAGNVVGLGHMGQASAGLYPVIALVALGYALADLGADVRVGDGVAAARESLTEADAARG